MALAASMKNGRMLRSSIGLGIALAFVSLAAILMADLKAQTDGQKPPSTKKEEVYETKDKKPKKTIKVDDDDDEPVIKVPAKAKTSDTSELATAFKGHPALESLYRVVGTLHDEVTVDNRKVTIRVMPLDKYFPPPAEGAKIRASLKLFEIDEDGKPSKRPSGVDVREYDSIIPYEKLAINRIDAFLNENYDRLTSDNKKYLSTERVLQAASLAMETVAQNHGEMLDKGDRKGDSWQPVTEEVKRNLLRINLKYLTYLKDNHGWDKTYEAAGKMAKDHLIESERNQIAQPLLSLCDKLLEGGQTEAKLKEAQKRLALIEQKFPGTAAKGAAADRLKGFAESLLNQANELAQKGDTPAALDVLKTAEAIWPTLPGLHDQQLKLSNAFPILKVAVRDLPVDFLPGLAATDSERWAGELLFEGLIRPNFDADGYQDYVPVLADSRPRLVTLGRQFQLYRDIRWSDGRLERLTGADVVHTVSLLKNDKWPGHNAAWSELLEKVGLVKDNHQVTLTLSRGHADPLSAMTFKILPKNLSLEEVTRFNTDPVGSGPFMLAKTTGKANPKEQIYLANNYYWERHRNEAKPAAIRKPRVREIRFVKSDDPVNEMVEGKLDVMVNPPAERIPFLKKSVPVDGPFPNRRIYFLALNNSNRILKNQHFRQALAQFINREQILKECFRGELGEKVHRALNGPYPAGSWACNANAKKIDDRTNADLLLAQAKTDVNLKAVTLSLKYPNDDPQVKKAMEKLVEQISGPMSITVELQPVDPHVLHEDVEKKRDYDLAYYYYDFPTQFFWLGALLDQNNYFEFKDEGAFQLQALFNQIQNYRQFDQIKTLSQTVHERFLTFMPFVPLWQLDTFIAHTKSLKFTIRDPLLIFPGAEDWILERN
jgi:ABC-type transport system substrate-binding protein